MEMYDHKNSLEKFTLTEKLYSFTLVYLVSFQGLLSCINALTNLVGFNTTMDTALLYSLLIASVCLSLFYIIYKRHIKLDCLFLIMFFGGAIILTLAIHSRTEKYLLGLWQDYASNPLYVLFLYSLSGFVIVRHIKNYELIKWLLIRFSYVVVVLSVIVYFFAQDSSANQYMTLSYNMLLQVVCLLIFVPSRFKILHYALFLLGAFVIAVGGARGALVGLLAAVIILALMQEYSRNKKILIVVAFAFLLVITLIFYEGILTVVDMQLIRWGITSRTLTSLLGNASFELSSGRFEIQTYLLENFKILGHGLFGDRVLFEQSGFGTISYAHNVFLEWMVDFGVLGILMVISYLFLFSKCIVSKKHSREWILFVIFIPNGLVQLLFSGSYLNQSPCFYILLGLMINSLKSKDEKWLRLNKL